MLLTEITNDSQIDEFIERVSKECKPFLYAKDPGQLLYRGMQIIDEILYNKIIRKHRVPTDIPHDFHSFIDRYFKQHFDYYFRSNAMFMTSNYGFASAYGQVYAVYPVDSFQFLWSPKVKDLYPILAKIMRQKYKFDIQEFESGYDNEQIEKILNDLSNILKDLEYKNTDLDEAINSGNEIMIGGDSYHAFRVKNENGKIVEAINMDKQINKRL